MIQEGLVVFLLAAAYDLLLGEPPARIHPVVWIGRLIAFLRARAKTSQCFWFCSGHYSNSDNSSGGSSLGLGSRPCSISAYFGLCLSSQIHLRYEMSFGGFS